MKIFGDIQRLINLVFRKNGQDITLRPNQSTTYTAARDMQLPPGDTDHVVVSATSSQALTNKTLVVSSNTITTAASGNLSATELNAALSELQSDIDTRSTSSALSSHTGATAAHGTTGSVVGTSDSQALTNKTIVVASNTVTTAASGNLAATELNAALSELQGDIDTRATSAALSGHTGASSGVHGITGSVVGTTDGQILTNKTLTTPTIGDFTNAGHTHTNAASGGQLDHTNLSNIGSNTHANIDTHIAASTNVHGITGGFASTTQAQTLTNKTLGVGTVWDSEAASITANNITPTAGKPIQRITSGSLLNTITGTADGKYFILINETGSDITIADDSGSGSTSIRTGTNLAITLKNNASIAVVYDATLSRWICLGGSGGAGGMTVSAVTSSSFNSSTLANNTHYLVDFSAAAANASATLPAGSSGAAIQVTAFANKSNAYRATINANGSEVIYYNGSEYNSILIQPSDYSVLLCWDNTAPTSRWVAVDYPVSTSGSATGSGDFNLCANPNDAYAGWASSGGGSATTSTSNLPLGPTIPTSIAIAGSAANDYARYRFTMPTSLKNRKLSIEWQQIASTLTSGDFKVEVYTNSASDYSGTYTELALSTDSSGTSSIPNLDGQYRSTYDSNSASYYELRIVRTGSGAKTLYIAGLLLGYRNVIQGAVVGEWTSCTPTGSWVSNTTYSGKYQRIGSSARFVFKALTSGAPTSTSLLFTLPSGFTIDTTALANADTGNDGGLGIASILDSGTSVYLGRVGYHSTTQVRPYVTKADSTYDTPTSISQVVPITFASGDYVIVDFTVPIAEWAGSGTVNVAQNDVEFSSNSNSTNTASDTSSFAYGPAGSLIPNGAVGTTYSRRVQFQSIIQNTDQLVLEVNDGLGWVPIGERLAYKMWQSTAVYGSSIDRISGNNNAVTVNFASSGAYPSGATYGSAGLAWSGLSTWYWRVRKTSAGAAVGFGIVSGTSAGLMPASNSNLDDATATRLGLKQYLHGTTYNGGNAPTVTVISGGSLTSVDMARFIPYQLSDNTWRMKATLSIRVSSGSRASQTFNVNGIATPNIAASYQTFVGTDTNISMFGYITSNTSQFNFVHATATVVYYIASIDIELASKPTWAY